jgi:hypothetical protein
MKLLKLHILYWKGTLDDIIDVPLV